MRHAALALLVICAFSEVQAQTISVGDMVESLSPGISVRVIRESPHNVNGQEVCQGPLPLPWECGGNGVNGGSLITIGADAAGNAYHITSGYTDFGDGRTGALLRRITPTGVTQDLARVFERVCLSADCSISKNYANTASTIDVTGGRILIAGLTNYCDPSIFPCSGTLGIVEISALPQMFDTLLTFIPQGQTLSSLTPAHPDGFRSADSMQVWTGNVRTLPDWSHAQALTCSAATNPAPGQLMTIADTLADPVIGQGRYYVTASVNGSNRRLGRQYVNGAFSARDPATLPVCQ